MSYGFRLFKVTMGAGLRGWKPVDFTGSGVNGEIHYVEHLDQVLSLLETLDTLTGQAKLTPSDGDLADPVANYQGVRDAAQGTPRITFLSHTRQGNNIMMKVRYGRVGPYDDAMGYDSTDNADIRGKAPGHPFRAYLFLPSAGEVGVLAVEVVARRSPVKVLVNWLGKGSYEFMVTQDAAGELLVPRADARSWRLLATAVADLPRLRAMVQHASDVRIRMSKRSTSGSGKTRETIINMESPVRTAKDRSRVVAAAGALIGLDGNALAGQAGIVQLADVVDDPAVSYVGFTDAVVVVTDDNGTKTIGPGHLDDVFVYPVSVDRPTDDTWLTVVKNVVAGMQTHLEVDLDMS